ncbi:MerR family DNA-binding transcriptional regulator [Streptomyces sp. NPDC101160]|uniref:MerR family DNA-binding transcriptional regulator n=1 Tax=Streptomyces sp. NPDC101160 TaxID=3366118 RepID=UPI0037F8CBA8
MAWPIAEVARMSGVTARTLRHYDEVGLLPPARVGEIGRVLAEQVDEVEALRGHHRRLVEERDRLDALAATVSRTITDLERSRKDGTPMTAINRPENLFEGVRPDDVAESLRDFPEHAERVAAHTATLTASEADAAQRERTAQMVRLAELLAAGHPAGAAPVQTEVAAQYAALTALRTVTPAEYRAFAAACTDNPAWRAAYESVAEGLAAYQRAAMETYADARLS